MADFRKRLLGFAGTAMLFAGIANAQFTCTTIAPVQGSGLIRAEGQTELIQQLAITGCSGAAPTATTIGTVQIFLSSGAGAVTVTSPPAGLTTTSQVLTAGQVTPNGSNQVVPPGATEAQLTVAGAGIAGETYFGTASGGTVTFSNVNLSGGIPTSFTISNIRVNASTVSATGAPVPITAFGYVSVSGATIVATATNSTTVALVLQGLQTAKIFNSAAQTSGGVTGISSPFGVCGSINSSNTVGTATPNFFISVNENFANAFKTKNGTGVGVLGSAYASGSESSNVGVDPAVVTSGTRFQIQFANVPSGMNVFVPLTVVAPDGAVLLATQAGTGAFSAPAAATTPNSISGENLFQVSLTAGAGTAFYEVAADNPGLDVFSIPVTFNAGTNAVVNQASSVTANVSFAPQNALLTGPAASVPLFTTTSTPATVVGFTLCQTSLLFPFVTNQAGFETGIAISNTTKDPSNQAKAQSGTCSLNYYGTGGTNPAQTTAPNNNEGPIGGVFAAGESYAFTLSSALAVSGSTAASFSGYMIAVCQFQDAHGFAYITYQFPGPSSSTMGYLALVLNRGNLSTGAEQLEN